MCAVFFSLCKCACHCHFLYFCELMFLSDNHVVGQTIQPWRYEQRNYMLLCHCHFIRFYDTMR